MTAWKRYLDHLRISVFSNQGYVDHNDSRELFAVNWVESSMKGRFPGNYTVIEFYDPNHHRYDYGLVFSDKNEELMWKLKWS